MRALELEGYDIVMTDGANKGYYKAKGFMEGKRSVLKCPFPKEEQFFLKGLTQKGQDALVKGKKNAREVAYHSDSLAQFYAPREEEH